MPALDSYDDNFSSSVPSSMYDGILGTSASSVGVSHPKPHNLDMLIATWLPTVFGTGFESELIQSFASALEHDGGFLTVGDLVDAMEYKTLDKTFLASLGFKLGHMNRLYKALSEL